MVSRIIRMTVTNLFRFGGLLAHCRLNNVEITIVHISLGNFSYQMIRAYIQNKGES